MFLCHLTVQVDLLATKVLQSFSKSRLMVEISRVESRAELVAKVWKVRAATAVSIFCCDLSTTLLSSTVLFSLPVSCSNSSKLINTSEKLYFAL